MNNIMIEVTGIPENMLRLIDERVRQEGGDLSAYIRNLIEKDIFGESQKQGKPIAFRGKKSDFDRKQWEADMKALTERAEKLPILPPEAFSRESIYGNWVMGDG